MSKDDRYAINVNILTSFSLSFLIPLTPFLASSCLDFCFYLILFCFILLDFFLSSLLLPLVFFFLFTPSFFPFILCSLSFHFHVHFYFLLLLLLLLFFFFSILTLLICFFIDPFPLLQKNKK